MNGLIHLYGKTAVVALSRQRELCTEYFSKGKYDQEKMWVRNQRRISTGQEYKVQWLKLDGGWDGQVRAFTPHSSVPSSYSFLLIVVSSSIIIWRAFKNFGFLGLTHGLVSLRKPSHSLLMRPWELRAQRSLAKPLHFQNVKQNAVSLWCEAGESPC